MFSIIGQGIVGEKAGMGAAHGGQTLSPAKLQAGSPSGWMDTRHGEP